MRDHDPLENVLIGYSDSFREYMSDLITTCAGGTQIHSESHTLSQRIRTATNLGSKRIVYLLFLQHHFGDRFPAEKAATLMAKVFMAKEGRVQEKFHAHYNWNGGYEGCELLSLGSPTGLHLEKLIQYGLGKAVGCPVTIPPSYQCRSMLSESGIEVKGTQMVDMMTEIRKYINMNFFPWYQKLSPKVKKGYFSGEHLAMIQADVKPQKIEKIHI